MAALPRSVAPPSAHSCQIYKTPPLMDGGLRCAVPTRPRVRHASYLVLVHQPARLLHASFRPRLTTTPLRFAIPSPPSSWEEDFHLQAVQPARHTRSNSAAPVRRRL